MDELNAPRRIFSLRKCQYVKVEQKWDSFHSFLLLLRSFESRLPKVVNFVAFYFHIELFTVLSHECPCLPDISDSFSAALRYDELTNTNGCHHKRKLRSAAVSNICKMYISKQNKRCSRVAAAKLLFNSISAPQRHHYTMPIQTAQNIYINISNIVIYTDDGYLFGMCVSV